MSYYASVSDPDSLESSPAMHFVYKSPSPSMTSKNSKGGRGHPYLRPLLEWKKGDVAPLTKTLKYMFLMQHMIHFINSYGNPK